MKTESAPARLPIAHRTFYPSPEKSQHADSLPGPSSAAYSRPPPIRPDSPTVSDGHALVDEDDGGDPKTMYNLELLRFTTADPSPSSSCPPNTDEVEKRKTGRYNSKKFVFTPADYFICA